MKKVIVTLVLFALLISAAGAQEFRFTGFFDYFGGVEPSRGYENLRTRLYMAPYFSGYHDPTGLEWVLSGKMWVQPYGEPEASDPWDLLDEAYLFFPAGDFDFLLGQKLLTWGFADIQGPLNMMHSTNRTAYSMDEAYESRRADPLVQIKWYPTFNDTIELAYVPVTRPDKERQEPVYLPDTQDTVRWSTAPYITDKLHSVFANYTRYGEIMDWQLTYAYYTDHTPDFEIPAIDSATPYDINTVYNRKHSFGLAYATRLGNSTLSQDIAFNLTGDLAGTDPGAQNSDITINTQYLVNLPWGILSQTSLVYSWFINHGAHADSVVPADADYLAAQIQDFHQQPLEHIAFLVVHLEKAFLREKLKTQVNLALLYPNVYIGPRFSYSINDFWALESGLDFTTGDPSDKDLRRNPSNDNYYVRLVFRY